MNVQKLHDLRLEFWFMLSTKQQRILRAMGYFYLSCEDICMSDLMKVTKSEKIRQALIETKRATLRVA